MHVFASCPVLKCSQAASTASGASRSAGVLVQLHARRRERGRRGARAVPAAVLQVPRAQPAQRPHQGAPLPCMEARCAWALHERWRLRKPAREAAVPWWTANGHAVMVQQTEWSHRQRMPDILRARRSRPHHLAMHRLGAQAAPVRGADACGGQRVLPGGVRGERRQGAAGPGLRAL